MGWGGGRVVCGVGAAKRETRGRDGKECIIDVCRVEKRWGWTVDAQDVGRAYVRIRGALAIGWEE